MRRVRNTLRLPREVVLVSDLGPGNYLRPTLFTDATNDMKIAREEIFGPVLAAIPFTTEEEAVALANDTRYGLAGYVWTSDSGRGIRMAEALEAGMVWVNSENNPESAVALRWHEAKRHRPRRW